jgi:hypothetical protein
MLTMTSNIVTKEQTSFTELLDDQEGVILDLENLHYYTLNAAAVFLWKRLRSAAASSVEELSDALSGAFKISRRLAELDTQAFLDELESNDLIAYSDKRGAALAVQFSATVATFSGYEPPQLKISNSLTNVTLSGSSTIATAAIATG